MSSTSPERPNDRALAGLRIAVGAFFLIFGSYKVLWTGFTLHGGFQKWITGWLADGSAYPFMAPVLRNVVLPHGTAIAFLVAYGETAIGISLIIGVLSRPASAAGFLYGLAASDLRPEELAARDRLYEVIVAVRAVKAR